MVYLHILTLPENSLRKNLPHIHLKYGTREDKQLHKLLKNALTSQLVNTKDTNVLAELNEGNSTSDFV